MIAVIKANLPVFLIIAPLFVGILLPVFGRRLRLVEGFVISVESLRLIGAAYLTYIALVQKTLPVTYSMGGWDAPWGIELRVDSLAVLFILVISLTSLSIVLYTKGNLESEVGSSQRVARFYVLYLLLIGSMTGMALTNDMFNVYVLVEVATLSCCGLVSSCNKARAAEAAFTYLMLATIGSAMVLGGIGFIYIITGHLNMSFAAKELAIIWQDNPHVVWLAASFLLVGFGVKAALFPLHIWLPDAHAEAPTPASAILSGLAVKGYIILFLKFLFNVFGNTLLENFAFNKILELAGTVAIIAGSVSAIMQDDLKRRLAFSTIAQVGYLFLGIGLVNEKGLAGMLFYLVSHAFIKITLFLSAGAIIKTTGKRRISELSGIGKKMPLTMGAFTIASLALVGIPLLSGFIGKWNLVQGALEAGNILSTAVIIAGSVLCAAYLFPLINKAYFRATPKTNWQDPGLLQRISLILLSLGIILLGLLPGTFLDLSISAARDLLTLP